MKINNEGSLEFLATPVKADKKYNMVEVKPLIPCKVHLWPIGLLGSLLCVAGILALYASNVAAFPDKKDETGTIANILFITG
ncbi:hypothetical protein SK128_013813, partial [Halocaridina rubra]